MILIRMCFILNFESFTNVNCSLFSRMENKKSPDHRNAKYFEIYYMHAGLNFEHK